MPVRQRLLLIARLLILTLPATLLIRVGPASAQNQDNSIADTGLQILQGLSPDQRDAITQQLGNLSGNGGAGGGLGNSRQRSLETNQPADQGLLNEQRLELEQQKAEFDRLSPYLKGEDWIVITIDSSPLPAVNPATNLPLGTQGSIPGQQNPLGN